MTARTLAQRVNDALPEWAELVVWERFSIPLGVKLRTKRGLAAIRHLARLYSPRAGDLSIVAAVASAVVGLLAIALFAYFGSTTDEVEIGDPTAVFAAEASSAVVVELVGAIVVAIVIGMVVHEAAHAVAAEVGNVEVEEWGVFCLAIAPMGAYVGLDDDDLARAGIRSRLRIVSAGVFMNLVVAFFAVLLLAGTPPPTTEMPTAITEGGSIEAAVAFTEWLSPLQSLLFWTAYLNLGLAIGNAVPMRLHDGDHLARDLIRAACRRLDVETSEQTGARPVRIASVLILVLLAIGLGAGYLNGGGWA